jgi:hypothetical protein
MLHVKGLIPTFVRGDNKKVIQRFVETTQRKVESRIFFREIVQNRVLSWFKEMGWRWNGIFLPFGDNRLCDTNSEITTVSQYRKEASLWYYTNIHRAVYQVEYQ